jgi:proline iminopeptidase
MKKLYSLIALLIIFVSCNTKNNERIAEKTEITSDYLKLNTPGKFQAGGVQMITLKEGYKVWTKRIGNNPKIKVLLLHGGPALTHEYMECFESFFPQAGIEFYHYDQLGSYYSEQPNNDSLWSVNRFVEEVEQIRLQLGLTKDNFFILGNSWGGILAMEYALKYQHHLKGMIISNMTADFDKYEAYNAKLRKEMRASLVDSLEFFEKKNDYHNQKYLDLVFEEYYTKHILRLPSKEWPEPVLRSFKHVNGHVYEYMQGPSEFVPGGILKHWSVWNRLKELVVPTLMIGAKYDTMNPAEMEEMSKLVKKGKYLYCANGSHLSMWDEQEFYMKGVIDFIKGVK